MQLCEYGCGREAHFPFKNGKWCCSSNMAKCPAIRKRNSTKIKAMYQDPNSVYNSILYKKKLSDGVRKAYKNPELIEKRRKESTGRKKSKESIEKWSKILKELWKDPNNKYNLHKHTIKNINRKYPFFSKLEEMRYNPDKPDEKEIQVHCKNHNCKNSKEKGGWFTPTYIQLYERIRQLENKDGNEGVYLYCWQKCKDECPLYGVKGDPLKENNLPYTDAEYQTCRAIVLERENGLCEYCGEPATDMHHIFPVKKEPFFALDPDYCVACCEKHHYKYGHKDECSTGNLAKIVCSVESQKFLNQKI